MKRLVTLAAVAAAADLVTFTEDLFDRSGKKVGRDQVFCVDITPTDTECTGRGFLPGGQIAVSFALDAVRPDGTATDITLEVVTLD